mgnify:CR=1 FL=1
MAYSKTFGKIKVDGQTDVEADELSDDLTFAAGSGVTITTSGDTVTFTASGGGGASITDADGDTKIQCEESSDEDKIRFDTAGSQRMVITDAGKVGIGVAAPQYMVDISGDLRVRGGDIRDNSGNAAITMDGSANVQVVNNLTVDGNGSTGGITITDGSIAMRTGTGSVAQIDMYCESSNAHKVSIKAPAHSSFSGDVNFRLPASNGSSGQALVSDGAGNTSWSTISGGGGSVRSVGVDTDGNGSTDSTLESSESLILKAGTNVTLSESAGVVTINSSSSGGGGGSSESSVSISLTHDNDCFDLGTNSYTAVTTSLTSINVPANKTVVGVELQTTEAFTQNSGSPSGSALVKIGDVWYKPKFLVESYGYLSESEYWIRNSTTGIYGFVASRQSVGSSAVSPSIQIKGVTNDTSNSGGYLTDGTLKLTIYYT